MNILIVDDSKTMRMMVARTLKQAGFANLKIQEAEDGKQALPIVLGKTIDLVMCDWNMPNMTGIELLKAIRAKGIATPFGFVTSEGTAEMLQEAKEAGSNFHIVKPFSAEKFKEVLKGFIKS